MGTSDIVNNRSLSLPLAITPLVRFCYWYAIGTLGILWISKDSMDSDRWISMDSTDSMNSTDMHGFHGYPCNPWISRNHMESMDVHNASGYPWICTLPGCFVSNWCHSPTFRLRAGAPPTQKRKGVVKDFMPVELSASLPQRPTIPKLAC